MLKDADVARLLVNGYHLVEPVLPDGLNENIAAQLDALDHNPGDAIAEAVPELWQILDDPTVKDSLISLLGPDYEVQSHRHWHCKQPGAGHMNWHQDGINSRDTYLNRFLGLYYPTDVTPGYGPDDHRPWHPVSQRAEAEDANNILDFQNPLGVSQSDRYKERAIRRQNWDYLMGKDS